jgi:type IV secretion system protein VirD4
VFWESLSWWQKPLVALPLAGLTLGLIISVPLVIALLLLAWPLLPAVVPALVMMGVGKLFVEWPLRFLGKFLYIEQLWEELKQAWARAKFFWLRMLGKPVPQATLADLGTAGFATPAQALAAAQASQGAGVDLGNPFGARAGEAAKSGPAQSLRFNLHKHVLMIAGTRGGKGTSYIIPNLLTYGGGVFVLDPKGENARATFRTRSARGPVVVLDPFGSSRLPASGFNPLARLAGESLPTEAAAMASALVMTAGDSKDSHWSDNARTLLTMLILHVCTAAEPEDRDLVQVRRLLSGTFAPQYDKDGQPTGVSTLEAMEQNTAFDCIVADWAKGLMGTPSDERGSIISTARTHTAFLDDPAMRRSMSAANHAADFSAWERGEALSVFVCLPLPYFVSFARWLRLVTHSALDGLLTRQNPLSRPVQFYLDELATLGHFEVVEKAVGLAAGYGVQVWSVFQDWGQVERHYGRAAPTFWNNAGARMVFAVSDPATCELVSKASGISTVETATLSGVVGDFAQSKGKGASARALLTPDEIALKYAARPDGSGLALVFLDGLRALEIEKMPYFENRALDGLWDDPRL